MKGYDGLNLSYGTHTIKVYLQDKEYQGNFTYRITGNCKGIEVMQFDVSIEDEMQIKKWDKHDCTIELDETTEVLLVTLTNPKNGNTCKYELEDDEFMRMVVGIEIVDFQEDE